MIAEHIRKQHGGNSFKRLAAYVFNALDKGRGSPLDWKLADYVLDTKHGGEKVGDRWASNCNSSDPLWAVAECAALAEMNTRSKADKSYHLVVSFPEGEQPTDEQLRDIENELVAAIGFGEHKRISATHKNTDNFHLHIAICTVHPTTFNVLSPYRDHYKLQEACIALEQRHGLTLDNHERGGRGRATERERSNFAIWIHQNAAEAIMRVAAGAKTWDGLHREMARHGLVIKPRGAGLVIAHYRDSRSMVKASDIDRGLSFRSLTERLGPYQAPGALGITPERRYIAGVRLPEAESLWASFQVEREAALAARQTALATLKAQHIGYGEALRAWYDARHKAARVQRLSRADRIATKRTLVDEAKQDRKERVAREKVERDAARAAHQVQDWRGFLEREATAGNQVAVKTLDSLTDNRRRGHDASVVTQHGNGHSSLVITELPEPSHADALTPVRSRDNGLGL